MIQDRVYYYSKINQQTIRSLVMSEVENNNPVVDEHDEHVINYRTPISEAI